MKNDGAFSAAYLKSILHYSPRSGAWRWRVDMGNHWAGKIAGFVHNDGYYYIMIKRRRYAAHRLAWLYMKGVWPPSAIDHIRSASFDCRWSKIRLASDSQNHANVGKYKNNTSGFKGVCFYKKTGKWKAGIGVRGKSIHLGYFETAKEAHIAYLKAATKHFKEFARGI